MITQHSRHIIRVEHFRDEPELPRPERPLIRYSWSQPNGDVGAPRAVFQPCCTMCLKPNRCLRFFSGVSVGCADALLVV